MVFQVVITVTLALTPTGGAADNRVVYGDANEDVDEFITFSTRLASGVTYTVAVLVQPANKTAHLTMQARERWETPMSFFK